MAKRISLLVCVVLTLNLGHVMAQGVGIGTTTFSPVSDALLELRSTTSGFLMPRMTQAQRLAISSPSSGLMVYQTDGTDGFYYYDGATWMPFGLDDLGNHSATQKLVMNSYTIANSSGGDGIRITDSGNIGIGPSASTPTAKLDVIGGNVQISSSGGSAHELRFQNPAATFATAIKAGAQTANLTYTLPTVAPTADQVLTSNASGNMSWSARSEWKITGNVGTTASSAAIGATVNNNFMGTTDAKDLVFATNNLERLRIASDGNVGIGTIAPSRKFHVVGGDNSSSVETATTNVLAQLENTTNNGSAVFNIQAKTATNTFSSRLGINPTYNVGGVGPGVYAWYAGVNGTNKQILMYDFVNFHLNIAPSNAPINNVGIGFNQPTLGSKLTINGNLALSNGTGTYSTTAAPAGGAIIEGNVGIGTTGPGQKLQVNDGNIYLSRSGGTAGEMRFQGTSTGMTAFKAGAQGATNITYTLPLTAPTAGQVLSSDASGNMSWVAAGGGTAWNLTGNSGINPATNFIGTTDNQPFRIRVNNQLSGNITSGGVVTLGYQAGAANTSAEITAIGHQALQANTSGDHNTAVGYVAMQANTTGSHNSAFGKNALEDNTTGDNNTAIGEHTMEKNTTGSDNMAVGRSALKKVTTGSDNAGAGTESLDDLTTGSGNSALGYQAGSGVTTGSNNTFVGNLASTSNGTITKAVAIGYNASVTTSSSFVLGGTGADAVNVGINMTNPTQKLQVNNGNIRLSNSGTAGEMQFQGTSTGITTFKAGAQGGTNINYTLPTAAPASNGSVLASTTAGVLSWDSFLKPTTVKSSVNASLNPASYSAGSVSSMSIASVPAGNYVVSFNAEITQAGSTACACIVNVGGTDATDTERNFVIPATISSFSMMAEITVAATSTVEIRCKKTTGGSGFTIGKRAFSLQSSN